MQIFFFNLEVLVKIQQPHFGPLSLVVKRLEILQVGQYRNSVIFLSFVYDASFMTICFVGNSVWLLKQAFSKYLLE